MLQAFPHLWDTSVETYSELILPHLVSRHVLATVGLSNHERERERKNSKNNVYLGTADHCREICIILYGKAGKVDVCMGKQFWLWSASDDSRIHVTNRRQRKKSAHLIKCL